MTISPRGVMNRFWGFLNKGNHTRWIVGIPSFAAENQQAKENHSFGLLSTGSRTAVAQTKQETGAPDWQFKRWKVENPTFTQPTNQATNPTKPCKSAKQAKPTQPIHTNQPNPTNPNHPTNPTKPYPTNQANETNQA